MAQIGTLIIATFSVLTLLSIYVTAGPIGDRSIIATTTNVVEDTTTTALATTNKGETLSNETGIIDTLTTDNIDIVGGNETHIRQKRSCGCCCCRPCCCCCRPCCCCCRCCCCRCCCCCCRCCCCRCCCCRPCCCGCGGCGCCGCGGGGRKRRAIQQLSHKLMNKNVGEFVQQHFDSQIETEQTFSTTPEVAPTETETTTDGSNTEEGIETTTLMAIRKMTNAKIDSFGRRQF